MPAISSSGSADSSGTIRTGRQPAPTGAPLKPPAVLAPGLADFTAVVAAAHQEVDALSVAAKADGQAVGAASAAGQLYVPTRSLPAHYDVSRPFAPAPVARCRVLQEAYDAALDASIKPTRALEELAVAAGAPSRVLALARTAALAQSHRRGSHSRLDDSIPRNLLPDGTPFTDTRAFAGQAGPVEQAIRDRGISDPVILLRAAAIDSAARRLMAGAENAASPPMPPRAPQGQRRPASSAAQLAAQSFPRDRAVRSTAQQPSRSAGQAAGSGNRVTGRLR